MSGSRKWTVVAAAVVLLGLGSVAWLRHRETVNEFIAKVGEPTAVVTRFTLDGDDLILEGVRVLRVAFDEDTTCELIYIGSSGESVAANMGLFVTSVGHTMAAATPGLGNEPPSGSPRQATFPLSPEQSVRLVSVRNGRVTEEREVSVARVRWVPALDLELR